MNERLLKHLTNRILNEIAGQVHDTTDQVETIRAIAQQLNTEAAAMEVVRATKEAA